MLFRGTRQWAILTAVMFAFTLSAPGAQPAKIPAVIKPGVRLVFYVASAQVPGAAFYRDKDGDFVDKAGNTYSQTRGSGGHGCSQIDVVAADAKFAAINIRAWSYADGTGPLYPLSMNGHVLGADNDEWWKDPAALRELPNIEQGPMRIFRGPYKVLKTGQVFEKTLVIFRQEAGTRAQRVYDLETGLLIHMDSTVATGSGTGVSRIDFVSRRAVELPWANDDPPRWFADAGALTYQGGVLMVDPRIPAMPMPLVCRYAFSKKYDKWAIFDFESRKQLPGGLVDGGKGVLIGGPNQVGGLWIHPDTLRKLEAGKALDKDDSIGTTVEVGAIGNGVAIISEKGALHQTAYVYDLNTGALAGYTSLNQHTKNRVEVKLIGMGK